MNIYTVTIAYGYNQASKNYHVLAKDVVEAADFVRRATKKAYLSNVEIRSIDFVLKVDIHYKTK